MGAAGGVGAAQVIGWVVTGIVFVINFGWNIANRRHANDLAREIRQENHQNEVWDRHRIRIEERLSGFVTFVENLPGQALTSAGGQKKAVDLALWGYQLNVAHDGLGRALTDADQSQYCHGTNWRQKANGRYDGAESSWDTILALLEKAGEVKKVSEQVELLKEMIGSALEIETAVRFEINDVEHLYRP